MSKKNPKQLKLSEAKDAVKKPYSPERPLMIYDPTAPATPVPGGNPVKGNFQFRPDPDSTTNDSFLEELYSRKGYLLSTEGMTDAEIDTVFEGMIYTPDGQLDPQRREDMDVIMEIVRQNTLPSLDAYNIARHAVQYMFDKYRLDAEHGRTMSAGKPLGTVKETTAVIDQLAKQYPNETAKEIGLRAVEECPAIKDMLLKTMANRVSEAKKKARR